MRKNGDKVFWVSEFYPSRLIVLNIQIDESFYWSRIIQPWLKYLRNELLIWFYTLNFEIFAFSTCNHIRDQCSAIVSGHVRWAICDTFQRRYLVSQEAWKKEMPTNHNLLQCGDGLLSLPNLQSFISYLSLKLYQQIIGFTFLSGQTTLHDLKLKVEENLKWLKKFLLLQVGYIFIFITIPNIFLSMDITCCAVATN